MILLDRATTLRMRRLFRRHQRQVEAATQQAGSSFDRHFVARLERLFDVQRFVIGWLFLLVTIIVLTALQTVGLNQFYLKVGPRPGGMYNEGMVGVFSNANPIFASGPVDSSISRLLFAGLLKYDSSNHLIGDLASSYESDESGKLYTVHLKPKLTWHDGAPLTSQDIVFTYALIQNPDVHSPLFSSWQGVQVSASDPLTVTFRLPGALTSFPHGLTQGILPEHILKDTPAAKLRSSSFNTTKPIGAGPFEWDALQLNNGAAPGDANASISLRAFKGYNYGAPKLDGFVLHVYDDEDQLVKAYKQRAIEAIAGLRNVPKELTADTNSYTYEFATTAAKMIFFKLDAPVLNDVEVRRALVMSTDRPTILQSLGGRLHPVKEPILLDQVGYDKAYEQAVYNQEQAGANLDKAGWVKGPNGVRIKNNLPLKFQIMAEDTPNNHTILNVLKEKWAGIGVTMEPNYQQATDFQGTVEGHSFAALLYSISIGPDPDVYVYWHSSQADVRSASRLNFSDYKSGVADAALEAGRTRQDPIIRALKYKPFLKAWQEDAPAIGLYQPNIIYVTRGEVNGLESHVVNADADRYYSVENWTVKTGHIPK